MNKCIVRLRYSIVLLIFIVILSVVTYPLSVSGDGKKVEQTEVSKYALSWDGHTEMPYIYSGPGGRTGPFTLEECSEQGVGFDCSAFTSMVYRHFGIEISAQSDAQKAEAKQIVSIEEAVPGDICWWGVSAQHVGIYLGNNKMVHTNIEVPPDNFPHVSEFGINYDFPEAILRMVDDVSELKPLEGSENKDAQEDVDNAIVRGSPITESDLTGMTSDLSFKGNVKLPTRDSLSDRQKEGLDSVKTSIIDRESAWVDIVVSIISVIGLLIIMYGILFVVCYFFDRSNVIFDIALFSLITLGKYRVWDAEDGKRPGDVGRNGVIYCSLSNVLKRFAVIELIGFLLISGNIFSLIYDIAVWFIDNF